LLEKLALPVGAVAPTGVVSVTVTVQVVAWPIITDDGAQLIAVAVVSFPKPIDADP
jgi:hypothetical protein